MGKIDISAKHYISQNEIFADIFNFKLFEGRQVIKPQDLYEASTEELGLPYGEEHTVVAAITKSHRRQKDAMDEDEFLSGLKKEDRIRPVITMTLYLGTKEWDGSRSLHEMLDIADRNILHIISNYNANLIISKEIMDFNQFHSNLKYVLEFIKVSGNKEEAARLLEKEKSTFKRGIREGAVDMCKAWEDQKLEGIEEGREEGIRAFILDNLEEKKEKQLILEKLKKHFQLDDKQAQFYLDKYDSKE